MINNLAFREPRLGTGRPQYFHSLKRRTFSRATSSRYAVNRAHSLQSLIRFWERELLFANGTQDLKEDFRIVLNASEEIRARTARGDLHVHSGMSRDNSGAGESRRQVCVGIQIANVFRKVVDPGVLWRVERAGEIERQPKFRLKAVWKAIEVLFLRIGTPAE